MKLLLANPRGFCAGVDRAIETVERALAIHGAPVYVRHEIVHNRRVVAALEAKGAIFVDELDAVPTGAVTIFSAHGVSRLVERDAARRELAVIDATCPLVSRVHAEGRRYAAEGYDVVLVGHRGHPEVEGTVGQIDGPVHVVGTVAEVAGIAVRDPARVAYVTQTTLSLTDTRGIIAALSARFPAIVGPDVRTICYATQNRQNAVTAMLPAIDVLLVAGARNSSNSTRLMELGRDGGVPSHLVADAAEVRAEWFEGAATVGLTAGASAPEAIVEEILARLSGWWELSIETVGDVVEDVRFKLPAAVAGAVAGRNVA